MNQGVSGNRKLFWKEVAKVYAGKVKNSNRIKDESEKLAVVETE